MKILLMYIGFYVLTDFARILLQGEMSTFWKETLFIGIIVASVVHDVKTGPSEAEVAQLEVLE